MDTILKRILPAVTAALLLSGCSHFDGEITLRSLGFEVGSEVVWNAEYMAYTLRLSLDEGEDGEYAFSYLVDSDPLVSLTLPGGGAVASGGEIALKSGGKKIFLLPALAPGKKHTLLMEFSRGGVSRTYSISLPDTSGKGILVRMDTDPELDFSRVILTNSMGPSVTGYSVTFYLDGELLTGIKYMSNTFSGSMEIDFARSESYTFELPYLVSGEHVLKVDVRSSLGSESTRLAFTEPQRRQTALSFSYNDFTGRLMLESAYNPLQTSFDITLDITVRGEVTYRHPLFFGIADPATETFTLTGETTARLVPGLIPAQVDGGRLKALMDGVFSNVRDHAANAIGNGNRKELHADITSVDLAFSIHSLGDYAGRTVVTVSPSSGAGLPITYTYTGETWSHDPGDRAVIHPSLSVNGGSPSSARQL